MPRDTNGNTQPLPGTIVSNGDTILPSQHNPALVDLYAMMTQSLSRDGQGGMRAPLDMSGLRIINVATATLGTDAVSLAQSQANGVPVGAAMDYAGSTAPDKWLLCFGQAISRITYADLFAIIGTTYGVGNGTTTFNLPDYRGRVSAGKDNMGGTDAGRLSGFFGSVARTLGGVLGAASHVLTTGQMPSHNHGGSTTLNGSHFHEYARGATGGGSGGSGSFTGSSGTFPTSTVGNHNHGIPSEGDNQAHTNAQPTIIMNKIIKVLN